MKNKNYPTFALVVRTQKSETPFLNEFLEYYKYIGINSFYIINTEPNNRKFIENIISKEFKDMLTLIDKTDKDPINECQNIALAQVKETFLLHLDMDEFLYLDGMTLAEFITSEQLEHDKDNFLECSFNWLMTPLYDKLHESSIKKILNKNYFFPSGHVKSMYYTKDINNIGIQFSSLKSQNILKKSYSIQKDNIFIFHVSTRGLMDTFNKIQFSQFGGLKKSQEPKKELNEFIFDKSSKFLPNRFILVAFQSRFTSCIVKCKYSYPNLKHQTDIELLKKITLEGLVALLDKDVLEIDLEKYIYHKMDNYPIDMDLVEAYQKNETNLVGILQTISKYKPSDIDRNYYKYDDFLHYENKEFIINIYNIILQREPDKDGYNNYLSLLQSGTKSKTEIIFMIRYSKEGRNINIKLITSKKRYLILKLYTIPMVGPFIKNILSLFISLP